MHAIFTFTSNPSKGKGMLVLSTSIPLITAYSCQPAAILHPANWSQGNLTPVLALLQCIVSFLGVVWRMHRLGISSI